MDLTLGYSPCPNDTFLFHALIHGLVDTPKVQWQVHLDDVEQLNRQALEGRLDVTKLSFHAYAYCWQHYQLLDAGSALGFGCGPLLISLEAHRDSPPESLRIAVPGDLTTAHFLLKLAYPQANRKVFMRFSEIEGAILDGQVDAGVIIHENRFTYADKGLLLIRDLGEYWESLTGAPIPLGGIAVRRSLPEEVKRAINRSLARSVRYARTHPEASADYVGAHAQEMDPAVCRRHIDLYVNAYSEDLGTTGRQAIRHLYAQALSAGAIPSLPQGLFLDENP
jgi:1,4-dihydroxy-6-naphthoate synthase